MANRSLSSLRSRIVDRARRRTFDLLFGQRAAAPIASELPAGVGPVFVVVRSWNRPLHLWASLDSFYRGTVSPCEFVLVDNHSTDPLVAQTVRGFDRRGMFREVHFMARNSAENQQEVVAGLRPRMGRYLVLIDGDVAVEKTDPDWLARMVSILESDPKLGVLGSAIDQTDFVSSERARALAPNMQDACLTDLIKARSPERRLPDSESDCFNVFPPAGRLLAIRTELIDKIGLPAGNMALCRAARSAGYRTAIANTVRHRHLSLLNLFDYPDYDYGQLRRYLASA